MYLFLCFLFSFSYFHYSVFQLTGLSVVSYLLLIPSLLFSHQVMSDFFCYPMDCSPSGSSLHGIFQTRILEWVAISYSRGSSQPRDQTHVSCISCIGRHSLPLCHLDTFKVDVSLSYPWIPDSFLRIFFCVDFFFTSQHSLIYQTFF